MYKLLRVCPNDCFIWFLSFTFVSPVIHDLDQELANWAVFV